MMRRPPRYTRTVTLVPYTTRFRSRGALAALVVATVVGAVALQVAANHARGLAFADLLLARLAFACIANAVGLFTALCLFAALGESTIRALVVAARLLSPGLLAGFSLLLPGALFAGAALCLSAPGGGLLEVVAGATARS